MKLFTFIFLVSSSIVFSMDSDNIFNKLSSHEQQELTNFANQWGAYKAISKQGIEKTIEQLYTPCRSINMMGNCPDYGPMFNAIQCSMIIDNIRNGRIIHAQESSYQSQPGSDAPIKSFPGGAFKFMPKVDGLKPSLFDGSTEDCAFLHENAIYRLLRQVRASNGKIYAITGSEIALQGSVGSYDTSKMHIWTLNPREMIKTIRHEEPIKEMIFSPDVKWVASVSTSLRGKLLLTCLDEGNENIYLSNRYIEIGAFPDTKICFNNASTLLAHNSTDNIDLIGLTRGNKIQLSKDDHSLVDFVFNHDDSRFIVCAADPVHKKRAKISIWDLTDLYDARKIIETDFVLSAEDTHKKDKISILFNHTQKNIVAISMNNRTIFFDVRSGKFLSDVDLSKHLMNYVGLVFMPCTSIACVALNQSNGLGNVCMYDYMSGDCIGIISYPQAQAMNGIGISDNFRYLIATFKEQKVIKTDLMGNDKCVAFSKVAQKIKLIDFYILLQLHKAKQQKSQADVSHALINYIQQDFWGDKDLKDLKYIDSIKNYFSK